MNRKDWLWYTIGSSLLAVGCHFLICILAFIQTTHSVSGCLPYLVSGQFLFGRWLVSGAFSVLILAVADGLHPTLDVGLKPAGNGQFGTARWATKAERQKVYVYTPYSSATKPGFILQHDRRGCEVDAGDRNVMLVCPPGGGKTKSVLEPTLFYNGIVNRNTHGGGASFITLDSKGEEYETTHGFMGECGYRTPLLDFRNPLQSTHINLLHPVNVNMDIAVNPDRPENERLQARARAERHAKILAESVYAMTGMAEGGENSSYFAETAKGLVTAMTLVVSEFGEKEERHIVSVFRLIVEMNGLVEEKKSNKNDLTQKNRLQELLKLLPGDLRAKLYAGAATGADVRTSMNVFSSALSQLLRFLDAEVEQMICNQDDGFSAEDMVAAPTCLYMVLPDEDTTTHFFAALFIMQTGETLVRYASGLPGLQLPRPFFILWDEFGQSPRCKDAENWFNAWRSRGIRFMIALQSEEQLELIYSRVRATVIRKAFQCRMYSNLPGDETAQKLEKELGKYTIATASTNSGDKSSSSGRSLTGRSLMTADEIAALPIGTWIVAANRSHPIKATLQPFNNSFPSVTLSGNGTPEQPIRKIPYLTEAKLRERYVKQSTGKSKKSSKPDTAMVPPLDPLEELVLAAEQTDPMDELAWEELPPANEETETEFQFSADTGSETEPTPEPVSSGRKGFKKKPLEERRSL